MSNHIRHRSFSVGKTNTRNDDFVYCRHIFKRRALGVVCDFTSDSPRESNVSCLRALDAFVQERIDTWREILQPAERLLLQVVRHINSWLLDFGGNARTTIIAFDWDLAEQKCHYIARGDSGLLVMDQRGARFLREGDREGLRSAAGFLPIREEFTVQCEDLAQDAALLCFTDGLWENTRSFLEPKQLTSMLQGPHLAHIADQLQEKILVPATRDDDLSMLLLKGEPMAQDLSTTGRVNSDVSRLVQQKVEEEVANALGGGMSLPLSKVEQDMVKLLGDTRQHYQEMDEIYLPRLEQFIKQQIDAAVSRVSDDLKQSVHDRLRALESELEKVNQKALSRNEIEGIAKKHQAAAQTVSESGLKKTNRPAQKPQATDVKKPSSKGSKTNQSGMLNAPFLTVLALLIVVSILLIMQLRKPGPETTQSPQETSEAVEANANPSASDQGTDGPASITPTPDPEPAQPDSNFTPAVVSPNLLAVFGLDRQEYNRETHAIFNAYAKRPEGATAADAEALKLDGVQNLGNVIDIKIGTGEHWKTKELGSGLVARIWFQARLGVTIDGQPGNATKKRFKEEHGARISAHNQLVNQLSKNAGDLQALDQNILKAFPGMDKGTYQNQLIAVAKSLASTTVGDLVKVTIAGHEVNVDFGGNAAFQDWRMKIKDKQGGPTLADINQSVRIVWLAGRLQRPSSSGIADKDFLYGLNIFGGQNADQIFEQAVKQWPL